jgi:hypothetical protein
VDGQRKALVDHCIAKGGRDGRAPWEDFEETLTASEAQQFIMEDPENLFYAYSDYVTKFGDPTCNGLGHRIDTIKGIKGVVIPGERVYKLKKQTVNEIRKDACASNKWQPKCYTDRGMPFVSGLETHLTATDSQHDDD